MWLRKKLFKIVFFGIVILSFSIQVHSQKFRFNRFTVDDGLQNNIVFATAEDAKGLLWFGTSTGIDRFDGRNFVSYSLPVKKDTFTDYISVPFILSDYKKRIWAASSSNIYLYNIKQDVFDLPQVINRWVEKSKSLTGLYAGNSRKHLLVGTNNTFYVYDIEKDNLISPDKFNNYVRYIFQDNNGLIWVSTNKGIHRFNVHEGKINELQLPSILKERLNSGTITVISQDKSGCNWFAMADGRIYLFKEDDNTVRSIDLGQTTTKRYIIKDIFHEPSLNTLVATDGGGLILLNKNQTIEAIYQSNEDDLSSLSNGAVYDIYRDVSRRLWVTTYGGGINVVFPSVQPFRNFFHEINNSNSLSNNAAKAVVEDGKQQLWFGTRKGVSCFDPKKNSWRHFNDENNRSAFNSDNVLSLATDKLDKIWAGTYGGGISEIDQAGNIVRYLSDDTDASSLGTNYVYALAYDSHNRLWAGGIKGPLSYMDAYSNTFNRIKTPVVSINCIIENSRQEIILATEKGVYKVVNDSLINCYPNSVNEKVLIMLEEKPGHLWLGTLGNGLLLVDERGKIIQSYKAGTGLPSNVVCALEKDKNGDLWIGTSKGIAHFNHLQKRITSYGKSDGLAGSQVNYGAVCRTKNGEIIFGTTNGFSLFNPHQIRSQGVFPKIVLTGLTVNNKKVSTKDVDGILRTQLDEISHLYLKYYQNSITIDFINTSQTFSGEHLYSWRLEGFENNWSKPTTIPKAVYTNLNYGEYTIRFKSFSKGSDENGEVRRLDITIWPPWWKTYWAYIGYVLLLLAAVLMFYNYYRVKQTRKKYAERLRLNTSLSHEIRTPLTLIKGPVTALSEINSLTDDAKANVLLAQKNIQKLESIINQFIDYQKSGIQKLHMNLAWGDVLHLLDEVTASFIPLMKEKQIHFTYKRPSDPILLLFDSEKMEKIFNNLLSNAIKYTTAGNNIIVETCKDGKNFILKVIDTGIGIPRDQQHLLFKGYFRAENVLNLKETGSGIGLNLVKELIELHHGKIGFMSEVDKGTEFIIKIPLQNEELQANNAKYQATVKEVQGPKFDVDNQTTSLNKLLVLAEDNEELRTYLKRQLEQLGFKVHAAVDGKEAWECIRKSSPDLVITDLMMPELNGFQLCSIIKRELNTCHIPVIMLTAIQDKDYVLEGYKSGADDYVGKPFDIKYIVTRIENLLQNRTRFKTKIMSVFEQEKGIVEADEDMKWLKKVMDIITDNLSYDDFSVEKLCRLMAMSHPVLFRKFKTITGESPQAYISQIRLRRAVELLKKGGRNINEVAFECGFGDPKYFSTAFKKYFGKTPTEYQRDNH